MVTGTNVSHINLIDSSLAVNTSVETERVPFPRNKLLQIAGNLISNAIKFTPKEGKVSVSLELTTDKPQNFLKIVVKDSGIGLNQNKISDILRGNASSTGGTAGEQGYRFGLVMIKNLVQGLKGTFDISSVPGEGTVFAAVLPQSNL